MTEKTIYRKEISVRMEKLEARANLLQAKAKEVQADLKGEYLDAVEALRAQQDAAQAKLTELTQSGESAWSELRQGVDQAVDDFATALDDLAERISRES